VYGSNLGGDLMDPGHVHAKTTASGQRFP
jgi:hypothetical protein